MNYRARGLVRAGFMGAGYGFLVTSIASIIVGHLYPANVFLGVMLLFSLITVMWEM